MGRYPNRAAAWERALVVLAMGVPCWVVPADTADSESTGLHVEAQHSDEVARQLALYEAENQPPSPPVTRDVSDVEQAVASSWLLQLLVVGGLLGLVHNLAVANRGVLKAVGQLDAVALFRDGEWWRPITALTLHADSAHLTANCVTLAFFAHFVTRRFGLGVGWAWIVAGGVLGNLVTAAVFHTVGHVAIGASTAVFAALGLLAGASIDLARSDTKGGRSGQGWRRRALPWMSAAVLLALLGAGGSRTDVVAHLAGFVVGAVLGVMAGRMGSVRPSGMSQWTAGFSVLVLLLLAWSRALWR